jgi:hypothetical protein
MNLKRRNGSRVIAALVLFSVVQISFQIGLAEPNETTIATPVLQQVVARLTTRNNQPITVNGISAATGATILTGATIETGADQSATVNLGPLGSLDIAPNTKIVLTYDDQGNVKVVVLAGCAVLTAKKDTKGEVATEQGTAEKNDPAAGGVLRLCNPPVPAPTTPTSGTTGGGLFGLGTAATVAIFTAGGLAALTPVFFFQDNPSGSTP